MTPSLLQAAPTWRCFMAPPSGLKIERPDAPPSGFWGTAQGLAGLVHVLTKRPLFPAAREGTALGPVGWPFAGANPWGACQLLVREDPAQTRTAPVLVWVEGQASIFPTPLPGGSYCQGLFLPGIHVLKPSPGPLGNPLFPSPTPSHQPLSLLCLGHLPDCPLCPHLV